MRNAKIAIIIDRELLSRLDRLVKERRFHTRSRAIQEALRDATATSRRLMSDFM